MYQKKSIIKTLQKLETKLNQSNHHPHVHYEAGYFENSYYGPYFYVNEVHQIDSMSSESFLFTLLQFNGDLEITEFVTTEQLRIIKALKRQLSREFRIGKSAQPRQFEIKLHPDDIDLKDPTIQHP